ncbi:MAG: CocE/NonD family hydrolase, partial [Lysobacter sp.]
MSRVAVALVVSLLFAFARPAVAAAVEYPFPAVSSAQRAELDRAMPKLAERVIDTYTEADRARYLGNLARLQLVAGRYRQARESILALRALSPLGGSAQQRALMAQYEIYAQARELTATGASEFDEVFPRVFREVFTALDDRTAALALRGFLGDQFNPAAQRATLDRALASRKSPGRLDQDAALALVRAYLIVAMYDDFAKTTAQLVEQDDRRRYLIDRDILVRTADGASICVLVARQRSAPERLPALLNFTIYANPATLLNEARRSASNGYAGVAGLTRGKGCSPDTPVPYEHDGSDAAAVIDWIATQPWSDGRVGTFGGSYEG